MKSKGKILEEYPEIIDFEFLEKSLALQIIFIIVSILSFGVFAVILYWHNGLRNSMYHRTRSIKNAQKVIFITNEDQHIYCRIRSQKGKLFKDDKIRQLITVKIDVHIYYYNEEEQRFLNIGQEFFKIVKNWLENDTDKLENYTPQTSEEANELLQFFGQNSILLPIPNPWIKAVQITLIPINVYQIVLALLFFYFKNYVWSIHLLTYIGIQIFIKIRDQISNVESVNSLSHNPNKIKILRSVNGSHIHETEILETDLVVGDLIRINNNQNINCDALVIHGSCLVNQAVLTGESVPVAKASIRQPTGFCQKPQENHLLYSGSQCIVTKSPFVWALVTGTGWNTFKGSLLSQIAKEKVKTFKFDRDFMLSCLIMGVIYAGLSVVIAIHDYSLGRFTLGITIMRLVRVIGFALQPSLLMAIIISIYIIKTRVGRKDIMVKNGDKLKEAGRVGVVCFDKTGTLTEDSVQICGFILQESQKTFSGFVERINEAENSLNKNEVAECIGLCNNLHFVGGEILGDPMDLEMFNKSNFKVISHYSEEIVKTGKKTHNRPSGQHLSQHSADLQNSQQKNQTASDRSVDNLTYNFYNYIKSKQKLSLSGIKEDRRKNYKIMFKIAEEDQREAGIVCSEAYKVHHIFDFTPERKRLSVIVSRVAKTETTMIQDKITENEFFIYAKGAPETIKKYCRTDTLPRNYDQKVVEYSSKGYRLISIAFKPISINEVELTETQLERELIFLGFIVLHNQQKSDTSEVIDTLKKNLIRCLIITGDSVFTGVNVALGTGIISKTSRIFIGESLPENRIRWTELSESETVKKLGGSIISQDSGLHFSLTPREIANSYVPQHMDQSLKAMIKAFEGEECVMAVEGDAFDTLLQKYSNDKVMLKKIFEKVAVYGRAKPDQKERVVNCLRDHYEPQNITIGFVGDGSNDSKALNTAHMGLSIGNSEASIAGSFSSQKTNISPVIDLLIEGRYTLENLGQLLKISIYTGFTKSLSLMFIYYLSQFETSYDYLLNIVYFLPIYIFVSMSKSSGKLNPFMPKAGIFDSTSLIQFLTLIGIGSLYLCLTFLILIFRPQFKNINQIMENPVTTDLDGFFFIESKFLILAFVTNYFIVTLVLHRGYPFKEPVYKNYWLVGYVTLSFLLFYFPLFSEHTQNYYIENFVNKYFRNPQFDTGLKIKAVLFPAVFTTFCAFLIKSIETKLLMQKIDTFARKKELVIKL